MLLEVALVCLAMNIYHEARGNSIAAQANVATVVMNRVASDRFPGTVCEVVKQSNRRGCQFSWWCDELPNEPKEKAEYGRALGIAEMVINGAIVDSTGGALYYHAPYVSPSWAKVFEQTHADDAHIFYKE